MFQQLTILGPGLLGASLALAVKAGGLAPRVVTWSRRAETRSDCLKQTWCDAVHDTPEAAVIGSDLVVICTPVDTILPLLARIDGALAEGALLTDVGSTKGRICRSAESMLTRSTATFVGSHPMAGSERTGMAHARADLFKDAACIVTPIDATPAAAVSRIGTLWENLGMRVHTASPEEHDAIVAHVSHLPHVLASTLCSYLATKEPCWRELSGGGFRDTTRVAAGDPELWRQILEQNRNEILRAIEGFEKELHGIKAALLDHDTDRLVATLQRGKHYRDEG